MTCGKDVSCAWWTAARGPRGIQAGATDEEHHLLCKCRCQVAWRLAGLVCGHSPVMQLAWIVEKYHEWTDPAKALPEDAIDRDLMLTNVSVYWFSGNGAGGQSTSGALSAAALLHWARFARHHIQKPLETPAALSFSPHELRLNPSQTIRTQQGSAALAVYPSRESSDAPERAFPYPA